MMLLVKITLLSIVLTVHAQSQEKCKEYDDCVSFYFHLLIFFFLLKKNLTQGPYCTAGRSFDKIVINDMTAFCEMRGFTRSEFGASATDLRAYCGQDDGGSGYRFTCCNI